MYIKLENGKLYIYITFIFSILYIYIYIKLPYWFPDFCVLLNLEDPSSSIF